MSLSMIDMLSMDIWIIPRDKCWLEFWTYRIFYFNFHCCLFKPTNVPQGHFWDCNGYPHFQFGCFLGNNLQKTIFASNVKHWTQHQTKALSCNWIHLLSLNCAKSHTLWKCSWLWPCPIIYLDSKWLQSAFETRQNNVPHLF